MLAIRHDLRESCRIVTSEVESSHRKSNRVTHCVKHEGRVQNVDDSTRFTRIVTCEVESSHRKSSRFRQEISHLEIIIPIHVRGCHIAKDNNKSVIGFGGVRHDLSGRVILKVNVFQGPAD